MAAESLYLKWPEGQFFFFLFLIYIYINSLFYDMAAEFFFFFLKLFFYGQSQCGQWGFLVNDLGWEKLQKKFSVTKGQIVVKDQI
jgi:hypothetical protein